MGRAYVSILAAILVATVLCGCGPDVATEGKDSIYEAAFNGDSGAVNAGLRSGFDVNTQDKDGKTLLHYAAIGNQVEVIESLTEDFGARLNIKDNDGNTALDDARAAGAMDAVWYIEEQ